MNEVNKTMYITLYGKSQVSKKGIILKDPTAEMIWEKEGFPLKGKSKSKWLTYYMGMRSAVFDNWTKKKMAENPQAVVIHTGCGMDSRINRIGNNSNMWYDVDFPDVIEERHKYYKETNTYKMLKSDVTQLEWLNNIPNNQTAIIIMEGMSMYISHTQFTSILKSFAEHFNQVYLLVDCYTEFSAKASKYKNPINDVGVTAVTGYDNMCQLAEKTGFKTVQEHSMTPQSMVNQLKGFEKFFFKTVFCGIASEKMYKLYEFEYKK